MTSQAALRTVQDSLSYFEQLTEAQQLQAAKELKRRLTPSTRNPSALLTSIVADVQSSSSHSRPTPTAPPQSPPAPATSAGRLSMQRFTIEALFLDNLSPVGSCTWLSNLDMMSYNLKLTAALLMR